MATTYFERNQVLYLVRKVQTGMYSNSSEEKLLELINEWTAEEIVSGKYEISDDVFLERRHVASLVRNLKWGATKGESLVDKKPNITIEEIREEMGEIKINLYTGTTNNKGNICFDINNEEHNILYQPVFALGEGVLELAYKGEMEEVINKRLEDKINQGAIEELKSYFNKNSKYSIEKVENVGGDADLLEPYERELFDKLMEEVIR